MSLRHALLGLLEQEPAAGYDLLKVFDNSLTNVWQATQSQIYTELNKLAGAGLISAAAIGPRGRKEYSITAAGRDELQNWLTRSVPRAPVRSEMLLRVFLLGALPPEQARRFLTGLADDYTHQAEELSRLNQSIDWDDDNLSRHGRIALEFGLRFNQMRRDWATWAAEQVN